ncbi:MAG: excalibur calcium-binding domain-containing protein [Caldilineaceae bacterium]|nr:excalibur calcium-binding domain-containing protein [Caldilineaceae bacterium]
MKRFFRFVFRLLLVVTIVAALILLVGLYFQLQTLSTQVNELTARVQRLEEANAARPAPGSQAAQAPEPTRTPTPEPTATRTARTTSTPRPTNTPIPTPTGPTHTPAPTNTPGPTATPSLTRTPRPTNTPAPTSTPSPTNTPRPTRAPTNTQTPTATPVPTPFFTVNTDWINVRKGPGPEYPVIDAIPRGEQYNVRGRNPAGTWLEFCCVDGQRGWIYAPYLIVNVDVNAVPTVRATPTIPPSPSPTRTPIPTRTPGRPTATPSDGGNLSGIRIEPENRCSHYDSDLYPYSQSVEPRIVNQQGGRIYGPYTGTYFASIRETDIEHIVARSEAHDSGLCAASSATRRNFANDLLNLTLASPSVNRHQKVDKDLAQWLPALNQCWYVNRVVQVKRKYNLSMDRAEAAVAQRMLDSCPNTQMQFTDPGSAPPPANTPPSGGSCPSNCTEAHSMGMSNMGRDHRCYQPKFDRDRDGIACER